MWAQGRTYGVTESMVLSLPVCKAWGRTRRPLRHLSTNCLRSLLVLMGMVQKSAMAPSNLCSVRPGRLMPTLFIYPISLAMVSCEHCAKPGISRGQGAGLCPLMAICGPVLSFSLTCQYPGVASALCISTCTSLGCSRHYCGEAWEL